MLKIDRKEQTLSRLGNHSLGKADITERYDLQEFISNSPQEFFGELGEDHSLISNSNPLNASCPCSWKTSTRASG